LGTFIGLGNCTDGLPAQLLVLLGPACREALNTSSQRVQGNDA